MPKGVSPSFITRQTRTHAIAVSLDSCKHGVCACKSMLISVALMHTRA